MAGKEDYDLWPLLLKAVFFWDQMLSKVDNFLEKF